MENLPSWMNMEQEIEKGWARYIGSDDINSAYGTNFVYGEIYPCHILLPERYLICIPSYHNSQYPFTVGLLFEIVDPFLININKVLE